MATRLETQARRHELYQALKRSCLDGTYAPGAMIPAVRELSGQHELSLNVVFQVVQSLVEEGVLYTVPRVGAFVGRPSPATVEPFLMIVSFRQTNRQHYLLQTQFGFEDRVAQLGGYSLVLEQSEALTHLQNDALPPLAGVFVIQTPDALNAFENTALPRVDFGATPTDADCVSFDDEDGGAQATRHLQRNGHRGIAFLGLHARNVRGEFAWSARREQGWRRALAEQGQHKADELAFSPPQTSGSNEIQQIASARQTAQLLVGRPEITAVVAANSYAAQGMFQAFRAANWDAAQWPAVVCFDSDADGSSSIVSYLRLPWEEIGREAAQLLWERCNGRLSGGATQRLVPMRLIPRLSCRPDWTITSGLTASQSEGKIAPRPPSERMLTV